MKSGIKNTALTLLFAVVFLPAACVTINIYFPASAAEKAADKIIDEVWQVQNGEKPSVTLPATPDGDKTEKP